MAVVGEAKITVVADTSKVREQIRRGFQGATADTKKAADEMGKSFNKALGTNLGGKGGIGKFTKESEALAKSFHKNIRNSYKWQAAAGTLMQSLMALGGGILALVGNMAGAAASGIALVGVMAQIKVAGLVGKQAFHGIMGAVTQANTANQAYKKTLRELQEEMQQLAFDAEDAALSEEKAALALEKARENLARVQNLPPDNRARREAELAYKEADLAYRRAKDKHSDLMEEVNNPKASKSGAAKNDPYKNLTASQKKFAQYLVSVMPEMKKLREAAASGFLPELQKQMDTMFKNGYFKMLVKGFKDVGEGLGKATKNFAGTLFDPNNKKNMGEFFKNTGTTVGTLGGTLGKAFGGFLTLMRAIQPLISRFTSFLDSKADGFAKNMQGNFANVMGFFRDAGDAAAGWGKILGNIFEKFKGMIKANVGPGTGGQLLLDYFNQGTAGFRGLDGAAGEFARKQHFLAAAQNLKAMLESLSQIFSFMSDLGTDPAIAGFWGILAELRDPLAQIFEGITGSSDELAHMLVTIVEIVASFADSGQLNAYMTVITNVLKGIGAVVRTLQPAMKVLGPMIGTIGGLVASMLLLKKVFMIAYGSIMILKGGYTAIKVAIMGYKAIQTATAATEAGWLLVKKGALLNTKLTNKELLVANVRHLMSAGAKAADAAGNVAVGATAGAATPAVGAFAIAVNSAIWPLVLIVGAIAAVIAIGVGLVAMFNQIKADNVKKANKELSKSFAETKGHVIGATQAQDQWTAALLSVNDSQKTGITNIKDMGKALDLGSQYMKGHTNYTQSQAIAYMNAKEAMNTYMGSLAKVAQKSLPEAQRQMRNMIVSSGMSRGATEEAVLGNKEMIKSLEKQAKAMGDTIYNADGTVNAMKAVDYAIGEGSFLRQQAVLEQQKFAETFKNAAKSFIDTNDAMQKATSNGKFSMKTYLEEMKKQSSSLLKWTANISKLQATMTDKKALQSIIAQGAAGADLVQSLVDGGQAAVDNYANVTKATNDAKTAAENYARAYGSTEAVTALIKRNANAVGGGFGTGMLQELQAMKDAGSGAFEIAAKFNLSEADILAKQRELDSGVDLAKNVDITASWNADSLADAKRDLDDALGVQEWKITSTGNAANNNRNGGLITRALGGIVGKVAHFADGYSPNYSGRVSGPGTGRSDQIPAMISNGEFVVNAAATAQNLELLNAINSGKNAGAAGANIGITINAAPGMDPDQVAKAVSHELNRQLAKGGAL